MAEAVKWHEYRHPDAASASHLRDHLALTIATAKALHKISTPAVQRDLEAALKPFVGDMHG